MIGIFKKINKIYPFLKSYKKEFIIGPTFKLIEAIFELIVPIIIALMIDSGVKNKDINYIVMMGVVLIVLGIVGLLCALICQYMASVASQGVGTKLRDTVFSHILSLSQYELDNNSNSKLLTNVTNDINQIQLSVAMLIRLVVRAPFLAIGATIMAMMINFWLSLIILAAILIISVIIYFIMKYSVKHFKVVQSKLDLITKITRETLSGIRVIKALNKGRFHEKKFIDANTQMLEVTVKVGRLSALLSPLVSVVMNLAIVFVLYLGGFFTNNGSLTQGNIIAFVNYITQILLAVVVVSNLVTIFTKAYAAATRVQDLLTTTSSIEYNNKISKDDLKNIDSSVPVEFKDVSFSYTKDENYALIDVNLKINKGEIIGIIGSTGCGKSTIISLMNRLYDTTTGEVKLFSRDIKDYSKEALSEMVSVAMQKNMLFNKSIKDNISGGYNMSDEKINKALKIACADDFVKDLDFKLDYGGKNLSGGQKSRLCIARAVAKPSSIIIFDDSFSALDYKTEKDVINNIKENLSDKTIIIVSQRIRSIQNADKILVLSDGMVLDFDTHENLMKNSKEYIDIASYSGQ